SLTTGKGVARGVVGLEEVEFPGAGDGLGAVAHAQLADEVTDVLLGGGHRDAQLGGELLVGPPARQEKQHLALARAERLDQRERRGGGRRRGRVTEGPEEAVAVRAGGRGAQQGPRRGTGVKKA